LSVVLTSEVTVSSSNFYKEALHWYESMANTSSDLMVFIDRTYSYRAVNRAYCDEHRRTREEILGHTVAEVFGEEAFETTLKPHFDRCLSGEQVTFEFWWDSPSPGRRHVDARYHPFFEADGSVSGVAVNVRDTTHRRPTEEQLNIDYGGNTVAAHACGLFRRGG
jgi:PAS domain S-box-containing protein